MFVQLLHTQTKQSADSLVGVYPLQVGNVWQYWTYDYLNGQYTWIYGWTERVERDSLMPNGKTYSVIVSDGSTGGIRRQLGTKVVSYFNQDSDMIRYDFSKTVGDTIWFLKVGMDTLFCSIWSDDFKSLFGQTVRQQVYYIKTRRSSEGTKYFLADGYGIAEILYEPGDEWFLRGAIINGKQYGTITSVNNIEPDQLLTEYELFPNYPNPFNGMTTIRYQIPKESDVKITIYNILGKEIKTIVEENQNRGNYNVLFDATNLSSGIYFYTMKAGTFIETRKMILLK